MIKSKEQKTCSKCEEAYPATTEFFNKCKGGKFGLRSDCKKCATKIRKARYQKEKVEANQKRIEWRNASPENKKRDKIACQKWRKAHPESWQKYNKNKRLRILKKVAGNDPLKCKRCGCDKVEVLEINHINGGGNQETKNKKNEFDKTILNGTRRTDDLEILCKICNNLHYIEMKFGELPFEIFWEGE